MLAASIIILIILSAIVGAYHISVLQSFSDIVDTEVRVVGRSIEDGLRAGAKFNLAANRRSFFADVEGVRIFVPLPQTGQPPVDLPDYNEDMNGNWAAPSTLDAADIDWDGDTVLDAPAAARFPNTPEPFLTGGIPSPAYDGAPSDAGEAVIDDKALYLFPYGLLANIQDGLYKESVVGGVFAWDFSGTTETVPFILSPVDEDIDGNGIVSTVFGVPVAGLPAEAALNWNAVPLVGLNAYYPDTYEDLNGDGQITLLPGSFDINGDGNQDPNEFSEDFNLNGFLDVPARSPIAGAVYLHQPYNAVPADPLSAGILANANPNYTAPLQSVNYAYASQIQPGRNFGYTLTVENLEQRPGLGVGFGRVAAQRFRITVSVYYDYAVSLREFQAGRNPTPIRVQRFELEIP